ncbi:MAG TPA: cell division protein FtsQ [Lutibacter sp.]|nr:cell division protein FtsQ [Lutibacter sp.]
MSKWKLYIISTMLLLALGFLYGFAQHQNKQEKLQGIEVTFEENQPLFLTESMVNKLLIQSESNLLSKPKSEINLYNIEIDIKKNKMMESAEVFYAPSGKLQVKVVQRVPIARIQTSRNSYYLDRNGFAMPLSTKYTARVPLVTGVNTKETEKECFILIQKIVNDSFYKKQIIGIHRKLNGDYLLSTRIGNHKVLLGKSNNIEVKMKNLKVFYKKEWGTETLKKYKLINLKYDSQVVCST